MTAQSVARYIDTKDCAKLVRRALREAFPDVKFSVRSSVYANGSSVHVNWTDGPTQAQVQYVAKRYEGASFDGMIDLKSYHDSELDGERVSFGADFVICQRRFSGDFLRRCAARVAERYDVPAPRIIDSQWGAHIEGGNEHIRCSEYSVRDHVYQRAAKTATQAR
jgi:hypothetical protein